MKTYGWLVREIIGGVASAAITGTLFGLPLLALLGPARPDPTSLMQVHERPVVWEGELPVQQAVVWSLQAPEPAVQDEADGENEEAGEDGEAPEPADGEGAAVAQADAEAPEAKDEPAGEVAEPLDAGPDDGDGLADAAMAGEDGEVPLQRSARSRLREIGLKGGPPTGKSGRRRGARCSKEHPQIHQLAKGRYTVDRDMVEYYTSSFERLKSLGWSGRYAEDDARGWKISGFGCNSPLYHAGLRRGDVIQSVNGRNTRNALQVLAAWKKLRKHDSFEVILLRGGQELRLHYDVI